MGQSRGAHGLQLYPGLSVRVIERAHAASHRGWLPGSEQGTFFVSNCFSVSDNDISECNQNQYINYFRSSPPAMTMHSE